MKKLIFLFVLITGSFLSGYAVKGLLTTGTSKTAPYKKVTGIGGVFFKCKDPKKIREWYRDNLGFSINDYGAVFEWRQGADTLKKGFTQWSPFKETTGYFSPSTREFMINYRVADLESLLRDLRANGVTVTDSIEKVGYGKFVHIMDPEGNKIELWEPNDIEFEKLGQQAGYKTTK